ncbi:hypothetical protein N1031_17695 [Herbiconiux moechotypicola]|uniref:Uncharacterized protein n=1 Tax=Herbiconiux moechotypicola TaxID=637393 RepID=A0ABP5QYY0_9MICO|nr:hypothetical protein [Herbiconiux moechotypicola]MCS5731598.1 hypothetical protein [Herbiconiux moechotypicola]
MSFNERLRRRFFGEKTTDASVLPKGNQMGFFGRVERPGGFDEPPAEPVELEGPLPWELAADPDAPEDPRTR